MESKPTHPNDMGPITRQNKKSYRELCQTAEGVASLLLRGHKISRPWKGTNESIILSTKEADGKTSTVLGYVPSSIYETLTADPRFKERLTMEPGCGPWYSLSTVDNSYLSRYEVKIEYVNRPKDQIEF